MELIQGIKDSDILINGLSKKQIMDKGEATLQEKVIKKTGKRSPIVEEILEKLRNEPWYDKVRRNLNTMLYYKIWLNPFWDVFGKK